jgi:transcriptional regulator with XRE-family HTH domain
MSDVRSRMAELRKRKGYTQHEFAKLLGKSVDTISNYERGKAGVDTIRIVIKICELLECEAKDLLVETFSVSSQNRNLGDVDSTLRTWWQRVFPENRVLGGKEIYEIVTALKSSVAILSDKEIASMFDLDNDLDKRFQFLVSDFESDRSRQYDTGKPSEDIIHNDSDTCACIFSYLKTGDSQFLNSLSNVRLQKFVRDNAKSGSPSFLAQAMALSDFLN